MSTTALRTAATAILHDQLEKGRFTITELIDLTFQLAPDAIEEAQEVLVRNSLKNFYTEAIRHMTDDDDLPVLPGLNLPVAIMVRKNDEIYYVNSIRAIWSEVVAGYQERQRNVSNAESKLKLYEDVMKRVRPYMAKNPTRTLAEALRLAQKAA